MKHNHIFLAICFAVFMAQPVKSEVSLPDVLTDGMMVQRDAPVCLWGLADPGERVVAMCGANKSETTADKNGKWSLKLPQLSSGGPYSITINNNVIENIIAGDVFLCSGQSNMELPISRVTDLFAEEVAEYKNSNIRFFQADKLFDFHAECDNVKGKWSCLTPQTARSYSALCYFFAKKLNEDTGIPVGIINCSWGGTPIESWISREFLQNYPMALNKLKLYEDDHYRERIKRLESENFARWGKVLYDSDPGIQSSTKWYASEHDDSSWVSVKVPEEYGSAENSWGSDGLNPINGSHWFRKTIEVPSHLAGKDAILRLGCIVDADSVFFNGEFIGTTSYQYPPRIYSVPGNLVKSGKNQITVRLISQNGFPHFVSEKPYKFISGEQEISLEGEWKYSLGTRMIPGPGMEFYCYVPTVLYNSMIHPLAGLPISGVVWYQGESNVNSRNQYSSLLQTLMLNWRNTWNNSDLPFYVVELAGFLHPSDAVGIQAWNEMRKAQAEGVKKTSNAWLIKNSDLGEWNDIHPLDKKTLGVRVAETVINSRNR